MNKFYLDIFQEKLKHYIKTVLNTYSNIYIALKSPSRQTTPASTL